MYRVAIPPSATESDQVLEWYCCGQSRMPMEAASSGVGKVISTGLFDVDVAERAKVGILLDE